MSLKDLFCRNDRKEELDLLKKRNSELNLMLTGMSKQLQESERKVEALLADNTHVYKELNQLRSAFKNSCVEVDELNVLLNNANEIENELNQKISGLNAANDVLQDQLRKLLSEKEVEVDASFTEERKIDN